ncbi:MAG: amino acid ABC transporter substrate-binding protein [Candidatus Rokubacteria bacterium]|nr:amino acid ABC transporter substrate-binding protein [Candidatus Rokubacteria bacterium]MBI3824399.1 amino acid ABC transporter substrate-binding protein [Candidatus Rokubacteria bacterium]
MLTPRARAARVVIALLAIACLTVPVLGGAAPAGKPVRIGSTLGLTGPLAATSLVHKIVGELAVERLNRENGLLGRPVEWILLDDQSKPELTRSLYERLVTVDKVDLLLGPYGTATILAAMGVAQRYEKLLVQHTFGVPSLAKYEMQFPAWAIGPEPNRTIPALVFDALAATPTPPKTVSILTAKFPSLQFLATGARELAPRRGIKEVLYLEYEFGQRDFAAIAARVKDANADLLWVGGGGLDANLLLEALKKLDYTPPRHFYAYPAPGPLALSSDGRNALALSIFEEHPPFTANPAAAELVKAFRERATKASLPYPVVDTQGAASFAAWQMLEQAVSATQSLDDKALAQWLKSHRVDTVAGRLRFDGPSNYGDDLSKIKQVQDGKWYVVWPKEFAAPGRKLVAP